MVVNAHLCAWTKLASHLVEWFVGQRRWRYHTVSQRERWEKSWLTMREMCPKRTVNLWIYYRCVTHREKKFGNLKRTRRMLLFVSSFSETNGPVPVMCDKYVGSAFRSMFQIFSKTLLKSSWIPFVALLFFKHNKCSVYYVVGFCFVWVRNLCIDWNNRWWKIRWKFSPYDQVSATSCWRNKTVVMWLSLCILPPASIFALWCRNNFSKFSVLFSSEN